MDLSVLMDDTLLSRYKTGAQLREEARAFARSLNVSGTAGNEENQDVISNKSGTTDLFSPNENLLPQGSESKQHKLGLDINYPLGWSGSAYDDYDVITVHGIRDDYRTAWIDEDGSWWVRNKLFKDLTIRELDYSYEIGENSELYEPNGLIQHAQRLIEKYAEVRRGLEETEVDRPVIWICHDLGGIIVKEALSIAMNKCAIYGKIPMLTTAIIFRGTPHRFQSQDDLEDQLHKLVLLPGPDIRNQLLKKVKALAHQVDRVNQSFLATKILDRAAIFNLFTQDIHDSLRRGNVDIKTLHDTKLTGADETPLPVTPFSRYTHFIGQSFEAAGRRSNQHIDHVDLIRSASVDLSLSPLFNTFDERGCNLKVNYRMIAFQARLLSLIPPTRALNTPFDPALPDPPTLAWIYGLEPFSVFSKTDVGPIIMHLHGNGNPLVDTREVSRAFYADYDARIAFKEEWGARSKSVVYFEFDRWDSRCNSISSMLTYLINTMIWRFWGDDNFELIISELAFLDDTCAWSLEDLYHLFTILKTLTSFTHRPTIFISCFDQCPEDQRRWFLGRIQEEYSYSEARCPMIISTSTREGLAIDSFAGIAHVDLESCPAISESIGKVSENLGLGLASLIKNRPIYEGVMPQLKSLLEECNDTPYLGHIILSWLGNFSREWPEVDIADRINILFPPTGENIVKAFIYSLEPKMQLRAKNVFNWIKHAAEPWSSESLVQALIVYELHGKELRFEDLDIERIIHDIEDAFGGIITVTGRDVKFSHPSFYHMSEVGVEGSAEERTAKVNSVMAETCLRYIQLKGARESLASFSPENLEGGPWATLLDAAVILHPRMSMAEYAVRFWPQHYRSSGSFKPVNLVHELFATARTRAAWEVPFWLFSNPFTRMQRSYISTLPIFAMLGLDDLVDEKIKSENNQNSFKKNCWYAITEAARMGNSELVEKLLQQVTVDEEEHQEALFWAAAYGNMRSVNLLVEKILDRKAFKWPRNLILRATATGLDSLLETMLISGCDINERSNFLEMPLLMIATWRNNISTVKLLLTSTPQPDLTIVDYEGTPIIAIAIRKNPRILELLLLGGASLEKTDPWGLNPVQIAVENCMHKALGILIRAEADFKSGNTEKDANFFGRPPLVVASEMGLQECVRLLLSYGADINKECVTGTALYAAIERGHANVARILLEHEHKPNKDAAPPGQLMPLTRAVYTGNTELVSVLIEHGTEVDFVDPYNTHYKTPLTWACMQGNLEMAKLLLNNKANINYTGGVSYTPLYAALQQGRIEMANYLLQDEDIDVKWVSDVGLGALHAGIAFPSIIRELLRRGVFVDSLSALGTALHLTALGGYPKSIQALLENDPKPNLDFVYESNVDIEDHVGCTPLQLACMYHKPSCVKVLLKAGANPNFKSNNGNDAVDILLLRTESDSKDALECLKLLLSRVYNVPVDDINQQGQTRLHRIQENTPVSMVQLLVEARVPLDIQDHDGYTPLSIAIRNNNESVSRYLIEQGASVNILSPIFGSIIHLAVSRSMLNIVKLLVDSGADLEAVDAKYGQSLLYTALGIQDDSKLKRMVQYLVDEAKAPIDQLGGQLGYPIIRAAELAKTNLTTGTNMLKFLIRRKAQLNVSDDQGRRAVHFACMSWKDDGIKALTKAGAEIGVKDKFGRMPIHFAASSPSKECFEYLFNDFNAVYIHAADHDNWTPLLWAARSGHSDTIAKLIAHNADIWARGCTYGADDWSALKLLDFANNFTVLRGELEPKIRTRINQDGEKEEWDDFQHNMKPGHWKDIDCKSCFVKILGIQWKCIDCTHDFSLCFKCYNHRSDIHYQEHNFEKIGPLYDERYEQSDINDDVKELLQEEPGDEGEEQGHVSDDIGW